MRLLITNTLAENDPAAEKAIAALSVKAAEHRVIQAGNMQIGPCIGCNACWLKTPGICAVKDDYEQILQAYLQYDTTVYIAGTALGFIDHRAKNIVDRILPLATMYTCIVDGQMRHVPRYSKKFRFGLVYAGAADQAYLEHWMERFALNMHGVSLGVFPVGRIEEAASCI